MREGNGREKGRKVTTRAIPDYEAVICSAGITARPRPKVEPEMKRRAPPFERRVVARCTRTLFFTYGRPLLLITGALFIRDGKSPIMAQLSRRNPFRQPRVPRGSNARRGSGSAGRCTRLESSSVPSHDSRVVIDRDTSTTVYTYLDALGAHLEIHLYRMHDIHRGSLISSSARLQRVERAAWEAPRDADCIRAEMSLLLRAACSMQRNRAAPLLRDRAEGAGDRGERRRRAKAGSL